MVGVASLGHRPTGGAHMIRLYGLVGLFSIALWAFCVFDVIAAEEALVRNLPKTFWLMIVIFLPTIGAIAWLALGRPQNVGWTPGSSDYRTPRRAVGPEDQPGWSTGSASRQSEDDRRLKKWEDELREREEKLRRREEGRGSGPPD